MWLIKTNPNSINSEFTKLVTPAEAIFRTDLGKSHVFHGSDPVLARQRVGDPRFRRTPAGHHRESLQRLESVLI